MADLRDLVNVFAGGFGLGSFADVSRESAQKLWSDAQAFALRLLQVTTARWIPFYAQRHACHVQDLRHGVPFPCGSSGILLCGACGRPVCIAHAQVDSFGNGTCFPCIVDLIVMKRGEVPHPDAGASASDPTTSDKKKEMERVAALRVLGLKDPTTWEEIRTAHRELAATYHPDRARTPAKKKRAAEKSVAVNSAFATLKKIYEEKAA